ncbi:MAG: M13 family metallopeptidase [Lachnospiraceae bacterium]|nr:M13 family metallopeptidase [Lachnospiraceae bacterium]
MKRRIAAIAGAVLILFTMTGSAPSKDLSKIFNNGNGTAWVNSNMAGEVTANTTYRLQDDFAAAVNQEWILSDDEVIGTFGEASNSIFEKKMEILNDLSADGDKGNEELLKYITLVSDWDTRNAQGISPLEPYMKAIDDISNKEELYAYFCNPEKNPFGLAPVMFTENTRSEKDPSKNVGKLAVPSPLLVTQNAYFDSSDADAISLKQVKEAKISYILERLGYSKNDIKKLIRNNYRMEKKLIKSASITASREVDKNSRSRSETISLAGKYPLEGYFNSLGLNNEATICADSGTLKKLDSICSNGNLAKMKAYLKVQLILKSNQYLDRETFDAIHELTLKEPGYEKSWDMYEGQRAEDELLLNYILMSYLSGQLNKLYTERYIDETQKEVLMGLANEIIDGYREVLEEEEWLSDDGKAAAIEKLDAIIPMVLIPDNELLNYDDLNIKSAEDGGNLLEAHIALTRFKYKKDLADLYKPFDRTVWSPYDPIKSTTVVNSFYYTYSNAIFILAGVCTEPFYYEGISKEELLGGIGTVMGHEITHGFDQAGIKYDKDGILQEWFPITDKQTFNDKVLKLQNFYTGMRLFDGKNYDGTRVGGEATADMGGLRIALKAAEKYPDFDYDRFFRSYASMWRSRETHDMQNDLFEKDMHPLNYLRVNVTVQQFDEFYKTYDVKSGDGMYLDPDKRIAIW